MTSPDTHGDTAAASPVAGALRPFHLAIPVDDLVAARDFYGARLGCAEGRSADRWVDFDFFGHQLVVHHVAKSPGGGDAGANPVDGQQVPVPHFGIVLTMADFDALAARLVAAGSVFGIAPHVRFAGQPGEQKTLFIRDPAGNALEFKAFADDAMLFAR